MTIEQPQQAVAPPTAMAVVAVERPSLDSKKADEIEGVMYNRSLSHEERQENSPGTSSNVVDHLNYTGDVEEGGGKPVQGGLVTTPGNPQGGGTRAQDELRQYNSRYHQSTQDDDAKVIGATIILLLIISVIFYFIFPLVSLICTIVSIICAVAVVNTCGCCYAESYNLKPNVKRFMVIALVCLVLIIILQVIFIFAVAAALANDAEVWSSGNVSVEEDTMEGVRTGAMFLSGVIMVLTIAAFISTALFVLGRNCDLSDGSVGNGVGQPTRNALFDGGRAVTDVGESDTAEQVIAQRTKRSAVADSGESGVDEEVQSSQPKGNTITESEEKRNAIIVLSVSSVVAVVVILCIVL